MNRLLCVAALGVIALMAGPARVSAGTYEEAKLVVPGDGTPGAALGIATALDGNTLIVGRKEASAATPGSVQVFVRSGTTWTLQASLVAGEGRGGFGMSVALSGNTAVVGAPNDNAAYVFVRNGSQWTEQQKLGRSSEAEDQQFGTSVSVSGDVCMVGAPRDSTASNNWRGSTYVFTRSNAYWTAQPKLWAADGHAGDGFGNAVTVHNGTAIVGAPYAAVGDQPEQGAAYIFAYASGTWSQQHKLIAADGAARDYFGSSVGLFANALNATAAVGAPRHDTGAAGNEGAAYVFERAMIENAVVWDPAGKLTADTQQFSEFGAVLSVSGRFDAITGHVIDRLITVGASRKFIVDDEKGAAYIFIPSGPGAWAQQSVLPVPDGSPDDRFGAAVAASGSTVAVGAPGDDVEGVEDEGSAYVFTRSGTTWSLQAHLSVFSAATGDQLGFSVAISGNTALVGAPADSIGGDLKRGSATIYVRGPDGWAQQARLLAADGGAEDAFGSAVALSGNIAVVGAPSRTEGFNAPGKAYVFVREGSSWAQQARLSASNVENDDGFGTSVAVSGTTIFVGAPNTSAGIDQYQGAAYVFVRDGVQWSEQARLFDEDGDANDALGSSVAISGNTAVAGAPRVYVEPFDDVGSVSVFVRSNGIWTRQRRIFAADGQKDDRFGAAVALSGRRLLVGAPREADPAEPLPGSAYVFERVGGQWTQLQRLMSGNPFPQDAFGTSVAVTGDIALVGAPSDVHDNANRGSAHLFTRSGTSSISSKVIAWNDTPLVRFGTSVALTDRVTLIGAPTDDNASGTSAGAAYVNRLATDYGDAPNATFPTRVASNGARHLIDGPRLGPTVDAEVDGQPNSGATGDDIGESDDEDGVFFGTLTGGTAGSLFVTVNDAGEGALLDGWIDFNRDGDWKDDGERVFKHRAVVNGGQAIGFPVPVGLPAGSAIARVRLSKDGVAAPTGLAVDGEVEDVQVTLQTGVLPKLSINNVRSTEGDDGNKAFKFTVTLSAKSVSPVTVTATTANGTATAPGDYKSRSIALSIDPGQTQVQFSIAVVGDTQVEPGETLDVKLLNPSGATLADALGVGTIVNDD